MRRRSPKSNVTLERRNEMKARVSVITSGVDELEKSLRFYRDGLGLATEGIHLWEIVWNPDWVLSR